MGLCNHRVWIVIVLAIVLLAALPGCSTSVHAADAPMFPMDRLPAQVLSAPVSVRTAYQFAAANPDLMKRVPCYCGCGRVGHTSNYSCYVSAVGPNGVVSFDNHTLGCSLCVEITQDAMELSKEGKPVTDIRAYVDLTYSQYGTSNMP